MISSTSVGTCGLILLLALQGPLAPEILLLAKIKGKARQGLSHIPAYACTETMERFHRNFQAHGFSRTDKLRMEVAQIGGKELFAKAGDRQFDDRELSQMVPNGLTGTGMFASIANTVFVARATQFHYMGEEKLKGRKTFRFDYEVAALFSRYEMSFNGYRAVAAVKGSIWADEKSFDLVKLTIEGAEIPPELGVRSTLTEIEYGRTSLASGDFLIPVAAKIIVMMRDGTGSRNDLRFEDCRKYTGEAKLTFE